jgi:putative oxidoreductase
MNKVFDSIGPYAALVGRVMIAALFVISGASKIGGYAATQAYMQSAGVPGGLLPLVILLELGGGIAIVAGLYTRFVALLLAGFSILTAMLFHAGSPDQMQQVMFLKNLGLAGGFLLLVANGAGRLSIDGLRQRRLIRVGPGSTA